MLDLPKISADTPRRVAWSGSYVSALAIPLSMVAFIYLIASLITAGDVTRYRKLVERGVPGIAEVSSQRSEKIKHGARLYATLRYFVGNHEYHAEEDVTAEQRWSVEPGQQVPILYDPKQPDLAAIDTPDKGRTNLYYSRSRTAFLVLNLAAPVLALMWIALIRMICGRQRKLLQWGNLATGEIAMEAEYSGKYGRASRLTYRFTVPQKREFTGIRRAVPVATDRSDYNQALRAALTETPTVVYDSHNPQRNALYPMVWVKLKT